MKYFIHLTTLFIVFSANAQTNLYTNPDFETIAAEHNIIAIIPFKTTVKLRPKAMKNMNEDDFIELQVKESENLQASMYSWFLKRKKRGSLSVDVQNNFKTNAILKKNEITNENLDSYTPEELAKLLDVDAVIMGTFQTNKPMSAGAAIALRMLLGAYAATNEAKINMFIYNAEDGKLLINYNKRVAGSLFSSSDDLVNILMRKASRRIAYCK
ncbi:MAG: hypothetical protein CNE98_06160 [Bacteroidetes bacterium MED-G17]|nr:MAG: hypothetical protein CBB99_02345 [Bacteroidetes bacterium TMED39]PDH52105.1 MAG: hypothetical protein CNE98_06160 [Bacteroidetes bacterium MED-G17]|tara:strand:- start:761 stop:1399 length:639 start_codon:yes stop_codon:yes gene_type:complete